jgi:hypothetical protein
MSTKLRFEMKNKLNCVTNNHQPTNKNRQYCLTRQPLEVAGNWIVLIVASQFYLLITSFCGYTG